MSEAIEWYKQLDSNQRIALKELSKDICGVSWSAFNTLFSPKERLSIIHQKLKLEGFIK